MNNRTEELLKIRPNIPTIIEEAATSPAERFQNSSLRPIVKLQHDLIIQVFTAYLDQRKGTFYQLSKPKKVEYINHSIARDQRLRQLMLGLVIGHFTLEEWESYREQEAELRRRISNLISQRLISHLAT